ncbi:pseudouridine synthase [Corynebacterium guangdongense]|uniref:Pseudouridine synthase n=1 Tax=Corynebacterium guangdongense TaxID=1783348 RepID=A0ABU1ZZF9_9CORY|nr:pseudouridine synthase [Corynebacterium guangdongense]MDR7329283.1 23S rRNA pseudouridine2605 synthase [Corynebacterium guangdongense]WJZ17849.1 Ribosomal large subunit pseudouridine synthase B [Corynebacterium guangdongense]
MTPPARRDGTPEKNRTTARDIDATLSNAKPARKQNINPDDHPLADAWWETGASGTGGAQAEGERLQKVLARAGVASRRHAEKIIDAGRVEVNGEIVRTQGRRVNPARDVIRVDGVRVNVNEDTQYLILNKPRGVLSTMSDEMGRPCVGDYVSEQIAAGNRLFHVGRLDADTEGLLLLTNDGELANRLTHPSYKIKKTYLAFVLGEADRELVRALKEGVALDDGVAKADFVQIIDKHQGESLIRVELHEGRKHIVRRMLKEAGYPVQRLVRTKMHTVQLGEQKPGSLRSLNDSELTSLYKAVGM